MHIDPAEPTARELVRVDESHDLEMLRDRRFGQIGQKREYAVACTQIAASELANDQGMAPDVAALELLGESVVATAQMIDPNRRID
jgi:hypothetical protein